MRLDKFLSTAGGWSRKDAKALVKKGRVTVNNQTARLADCQVQEESDRICCDGVQLFYARYRYYMLNKPLGYVSATKDQQESTVLELFAKENVRGLFPVGRLDKDTVGLLLLTNDGTLAHNLLSPTKHVPKTYFVKVKGTLTQEEIRAFAQGVDIGDETMTLPAQLEIVKAGEISEAVVTLREGRFHQIKRMFGAMGMEVCYLKRTQMGSLCLDQALAEGAYRPLTDEEIACLKKGFC